MDMHIDGSIASFGLEGITSPCCLLIGKYPHHMTLLPSFFYGENTMESINAFVHWLCILLDTEAT